MASMYCPLKILQCYAFNGNIFLHQRYKCPSLFYDCVNHLHSSLNDKGRKIIPLPCPKKPMNLIFGSYSRPFCSIVLYKCSNCKKEFHPFSFKCPLCSTLQQVDKGINFYQIFDLKENYDIDINSLKKKYLKLQSEFHPDKFSIGSVNEKATSEDISSIINKAYSTLVNPYERGLYILSLKKTMLEEKAIQLNENFLKRIMELNEELEGLVKPSDVKKLESHNDKEIEKFTMSVSHFISRNDFISARAELDKMKYHLSIRERLKNFKSGIM